MNIYFSRHGESVANILHEFSNENIKHPLTERGIEQSLGLAELLTDLNIQCILTSPLLRAIQTSLIISDKLKIQIVTIHEQLREFSVGDLEGKSDQDSWDRYFEMEKKWLQIENRNLKLTKGESFNEIQNRFLNFSKELIILENKYTNILVITHGGLLKIGLPAILEGVNYSITYHKNIANCELVPTQFKDGNFKSDFFKNE